MRLLAGIGPSKRPIVDRCFLARTLVVVAALALPSLALAQETPSSSRALTEAEALRLGLGRPALRDALESEIDLARADEIEAGLWPNPTVSYSREQTFGGPAATGEDYAWLSQRLDLSGRRGLRSEAAERRVRTAAHWAAAERLVVAADIRSRFYEVLLLQKRVAAVEEWLRRMEATVVAVARRQAAGDVSGYDRRRLERERASARARIEVERAALARARERLAVVVGGRSAGEPPDGPVATGELLPAAAPPPQAVLARLALRPEVRALDESARAAELERRAASRGWVPGLEVGGGLKSIDLGDRRVTGFLVVASVSLPIFDHEQDEAARAKARLRRARGRRQLVVSETTSEARGLSAQANRLGQAARTFREEAVRSSVDLVRTAEAAYRGGEFGILDLLDAYRSALGAEEQALELEAAARRAGIDLDRLTAGGSP